MSNKKVAIYCRLSVEDIDRNNKESESIKNQKLLLTEYAKEKNWFIYQIYCDEDYSGLDANRPEFNNMINDAKSRKFDIILCKSQSRFTRDMELVEKYINRLFFIWGIRFVSIIDNIDTDIKGNKKTRQINALINEWYCEDLSENINAVFKKKMLDGKFIGSFACYGYKKNVNDKNTLIIDEDAANVVKRIFQMFIDGYSYFEIAVKLTEENILNPTNYKISKGYKFYNPNACNNKWSLNTIKKIINNRTYIGDMVQGKSKKISYKSNDIINIPKDEWIIIENTHIPIIDKETFFKAQSLIKTKKHLKV